MKELTDKVEEAIYASQDEYIAENFPPGTTVNAGWGVDEIDRYICTKVYGHGVLTSQMTNDGTITHDFEGFDS